MPQFDMFGVLIQLVLGFMAMYALVTWWSMARWTELRKNEILYPSNYPREKCRDSAGFLAFMRPRVLLLGLLCLAGCICGVLGSFVLQRFAWLRHGSFALSLAAFAAYVVFINQAARKFW